MSNFNREIYASQSDGFSEHNDCAVRAVATAGCLDYKLVHGCFAKHGRKSRHATKLITSILATKELFPAVKPVEIYDRLFLVDFIRSHNRGCYVIQTRGHMFALVDGIVHDWDLKPKRQVKRYWRLDI